MSPSKPKTKSKPLPVEKLTYEQALAELENIVSSLEADKLSLDESMRLFERGKALTQHCVELLDNAELQVKQLSGDTMVDNLAED